MATIKQVAERAQVSVATVSRVINETGLVSPDLEQRVRAAMEDLNYYPSALGRGLRRSETMTIGVLIPELDQPFFSALVSSVESALFRQDYRTLVCSAEEDPAREAAYIQILLQQRVDGVIYVPTGQQAGNVSKLRKSSVPVVLVDRDVSTYQVDKVMCDNESGAYEGMSHLIKQGHRRIGVIGGPDYSFAILRRMAGVRRALADAAMPLNSQFLIMGTLQQFELGYQTAMHLLTQPERPTAIFALTDMIAIGVLHTASRLGLHLPGDLSVMGFDDIPLATYSIPELTTVAQPIYEMGALATKLLLARLHDHDRPYEQHILDARLVVRNSVAGAATHDPLLK
ncbi:MAG: LacI family transcriptional regulator [Chloroflexi bacterium]|nr:LacI family transcriptional regulator [Chloroflexota bacterium]